MWRHSIPPFFTVPTAECSAAVLVGSNLDPAKAYRSFYLDTKQLSHVTGPTCSWRQAQRTIPGRLNVRVGGFDGGDVTAVRPVTFFQREPRITGRESLFFSDGKRNKRSHRRALVFGRG